MNKNKKKTLVVCHDAGGAEVVSAYVKKNFNKNDFVCLVAGPAEKIFKRKGLTKILIFDKREAKKLLDNNKGLNGLLAGTSWGSGIELDFIKEARKKGIKTASYLEHWVNYRERFGYPRKDWKNNLPDEIWVGDKCAFELASRKFKGVKVKYKPNQYFLEVKKKYKLAQGNKRSGRGILFASEPINSAVNSFGDKRRKIINEENILENILQELTRLQFKNKIIVRLHPAEKKDKYNKLINKYKSKLKIEKSSEKDVFKDLVQVTTVLGMSSMFLVVASLCGKKVISYYPGMRGKLALPEDKIVKLINIKDLKDTLFAR
ncbi:hypothetical protein KJ641_03495 [Patescibacteria group bacterium]|nr:hypothetical protein [Patescibacteria group bacterium]